MKKYLSIAALLAAGTLVSNAAVFANYNTGTTTTDEQLTAFTSGGYGTYKGFSIEVPDSLDGISGNTVLLESITFGRGDAWAVAHGTTAYLSIYTTATPTSTDSWLGSSSAQANVGRVNNTSGSNNSTNTAAFETVSFAGSEIELTLGTTYYVFFSTGNTGDTSSITDGTLRLGQTGDGVTGGTAYTSTTGGTQGNGWMPVYSVTVSQVPEPSAFGLLAGLGALALVASRRRRK